jgi:glycosyltransferase involved in cell wall biosynthesis
MRSEHARLPLARRVRYPRPVPRLSVVSPVYRAQACLDELHRRLTATLEAMDVDYEIVFVNDGSPDRSGEVLAAIAARDARVVVLNLSRNFGQHPAILAGLEQARGELIVVMDCDLQEAPEDIPRLYAKAAEGYDIVFATRRASERSSFKRLTSRAWFSIINLLSDFPVVPNSGTFSLITRQVVDELLRMPNRHSHYQHLVRWMGFRQASIEIHHGGRFDGGRSSYSLRALVRHAFTGVIAHSTRLLTFSIYAGFAFVALSFLQFGHVLYLKLFRSVGVAGWTSLMAAIWLIGGAILSSLGIIGLYLARVVDEVKHRPTYIVRERLGARSDLVQAGAVDAQGHGRGALEDGAVRNVAEHQRARADHAVRADRDSVA